MRAWGHTPHRDQKTVSGSLELELWWLQVTMWVLATQLWSSAQAASAPEAELALIHLSCAFSV